MKKTKNSLLKTLVDNSVQGINEFGEKYEAVQLLNDLKKSYPTQLKPEILSVRMYQTEKACYLEITEDNNPGISDEDNLTEMGIAGWYSRKDFNTVRTSLSFIAEDDGLYFSPIQPLRENAYRFIAEFDDYSKLNTTDLFSEDGAKDLLQKIESEKQI